MILSYEVVAGDGWLKIAGKLGGDPARSSQNVAYLLTANRTTVSAPIHPDQIVWYNPEKILKTPVVPPTPVPPTVPAKNPVDVRDFAEANSGLLRPNGLIDTAARFVPGSSTKAGSVPTTGTNPYRVIRCGGTSTSTRVNDLIVRNVDIDALGVGHNSHGLTVGYSLRALIERVNVKGVRGTTSAPPGETFALETWHADSALVRHCTVDGSMAPSATLFGANSCLDLIVEDSEFTGSANAFAAAIWQTGNWTLRRINARNCRRAINSEQSWGEMVLDAVDMRGMNPPPTSKPHIVISTDDPRGGEVHVINPVWDRDKGPLLIGVPPTVPPYDRGGVREDYPATVKPEHVWFTHEGKTYNTKTNPPPASLCKIGSVWQG